MLKQKLGLIINVAAVLVAVVVLAGNDCIIDPCPVLVRRSYDWSIQGRTASIDLSDASRIAFSASEQVALVESNGGVIHLSELTDARVGDSLESGGRLFALFQGAYNLDLTVTDVYQLRVIRLGHGSSPLALRVTAEWDIADCDERVIDDPWFTALEPTCGDGFVEAPEQCDDENDGDDDGCTECVIDSGGCTGDSWAYWTCEDEPSWCELHECGIGGTDPACDLLADLELDIITNGLVVAGVAPGHVLSSPVGVDCSCVETSISYECDPSCTMDVVPCAALFPADAGPITFHGWADGCPTGDGECTINVGGGRIIGVFDSAVSGIEREREHTAYPLEQRGLDLRFFDAGGGLVVAAGEIVGELENPLAELDPDEEPRPFLLALDDRLDLVWSRDLVVDSGELTIMDVAVDGSGNTLVVGGLFGSLSLEGGTVTVDDTEYPRLEPRGIVVLKLSPEGEHLWSRHVELPVEHDLYRARLAVGQEGTSSLVAVVDYRFFGEDAAHDLVVARISADGEVSWIRGLREEGDLSTEIVIDESISVAVVSDGSVYVAAGVTGGATYQLDLPSPMAPGAAVRFLAKLDSEGEQRWTERLSLNDLEQLDMGVDVDDQVIIISAAGMTSYDKDGLNRWDLEDTSRTFDSYEYRSEPVRSLAVDWESGEFVVAAEASTLPRSRGSDDHFLATLTSHFTSHGEHLRTVRRESWTGGTVFLLRSVSLMDGVTYVLGSRFLPVEAPNHAAVVRRMAVGD